MILFVLFQQTGVPWLNSFKRFTIIFVIFQYLVSVHCFPIIGESSTQETLSTTTNLNPKLSPTGLQKDSANKDDKPNEVPQKTHDSSMFEFFLPESKAADWSYNNPGAWANLAGSSCGGNHQSPINIQPKQSIKKAFPKFTFQNYGNIDLMDLINNGHTAMFSLPVNFPADRVPSITGGGLTDTYNFVQFHLHWGSDSSKGSEHLIRSRSHPAELHIVHYNTKYGTYADATTHSDGLAVLGVFLKIESRDNDAFRPLVEQLSEVPADGNETTLKNLVSLKDLLPAHTTSFYRYSGSLTTPKCNQIVTWTVFDNPVIISEQQLNKFRSLKNDVDEPLVNNFRPVQPLNDRTVLYRSFTGCEIPRSWPITWSPLLDAIKWSQCMIGFTIFGQ